MLENLRHANYDNLKNTGDLMNNQIKKIIDLNIRTFDRFSKETEGFSDLLQARRPEEFIEAQMNCFKSAAIGAIDYSQEFFDIILNGFTQANNEMENEVNEPNSSQHSNQKRSSSQSQKKKD